jgi:hypothetical protein
MKRYFMYGCGLGLLVIFAFPEYFTPICLCGVESNSWINFIKRFYNFIGSDPYGLTVFGRIVVIFLAGVSGGIFVFVRYIAMRFSKLPGGNVHLKPGKLERLFRAVLLTALITSLLVVLYAIFVAPSSYESLKPTAPGISNPGGYFKAI